MNNNIVLNEGYGINDNKIYIEKAKNCYIYDENNKKYIDTAMGGGSLILGHASKITKDAIKAQIKLGTLYTQPNKLVHKLSNLLTTILPNMENFVFASTGSEATLRAIRIARSYTNKRKIAIFSGGWHGSHDLVLIDEDYKGKENNPQKILKSKGSLDIFLNDIILLPYNNDNAFKLIEEKKDEIAMVFIEPSQGSNPRDDMKSFLQQLREITTKNNILLGFDEIITGFRIALGGAQEYYNISADIVTYGKTVGGGLPLSIVAGKKYIMQTIKDNNVFMGGTFSANPLSISVAYETINYLKTHKNEIYNSINELSLYLRNSINKICKDESVKCQMMGINSMLRFIFTDYPIKSRFQRDKNELENKIQERFYEIMSENEVFIASNRINFLSIKHNKKVIDKIILAYKNSIVQLKKEGLL